MCENPLLHLHHDQLRIIIDPDRHDAVAEAAAYDHRRVAESVLALVQFGEPLELGRDEAAGAGDDDLAAVVVAGEDEVGAEALVELVILRLVGQKNDRLSIVKCAVRAVSSGSAVSTKRSIRDAGENIVRSLHISVVQEDDAHFAHLSIEGVELLAGQTSLVIAADIVDRRDLDRAFDEVEGDLIRRVRRVDDVAGDDDDVGRGGLDPGKQSGLTSAEHLIMQV